VGARQEADHRLDRADGLGVAAVDAAAFLEDGAANDVGLELLHQLQRGEICGGIRSLQLGEGFAGLGPGRVDRRLALLLVGQLVGGGKVLAMMSLSFALVSALSSSRSSSTDPWRPSRPGR